MAMIITYQLLFKWNYWT